MLKKSNHLNLSNTTKNCNYLMIYFKVSNLGALGNPESLKLYENIPETKQW